MQQAVDACLLINKLLTN